MKLSKGKEIRSYVYRKFGRETDKGCHCKGKRIQVGGAREMSDDLTRIERAYGSVAEYNRCRDEADAEQYEREMRWHDACARNKAKLESAGNRAMWFCEDCIGCKYYEMVGPTSPGFGYEDIDDVEHGICHHRDNPFRPDEPFCKGKEEGEWKDEQTT